MSSVPSIARRPVALEHPVYQWEGAGGGAAATLRLFGTLGRRELSLVADAIVERARAPRDVLCVDFEHVDHIDFRALPEFAHRVMRHRDRGAVVWFVGMTSYVLRLFDVAGQGSIVRQLLWNDGASARERGPLRPFADRASTGPRVVRDGAWH
ncbi:MAG: STAS domain-containing protein [Hyphomicrobiales bacterium]